MTDKSVVRQLLGMLMQHPQYMSQVDKYSLTLADFSTRFERYLFTAISNLYQQGAKEIFPIDVANYLETDNVGKKVFEQNNGVDYLQDAIDFSSWENFSYYYDKLKKINLLRDLKKQGHDISNFYCARFILGCISAVQKKYRTADMLSLASNYYLGISKAESDAFKNFVRKFCVDYLGFTKS